MGRSSDNDVVCIVCDGAADCTTIETEIVYESAAGVRVCSVALDDTEREDIGIIIADQHSF